MQCIRGPVGPGRAPKEAYFRGKRAYFRVKRASFGGTPK